MLGESTKIRLNCQNITAWNGLNMDDWFCRMRCLNMDDWFSGMECTHSQFRWLLKRTFLFLECLARQLSCRFHTGALSEHVCFIVWNFGKFIFNSHDGAQTAAFQSNIFKFPFYNVNANHVQFNKSSRHLCVYTIEWSADAYAEF